MLRNLAGEEYSALGVSKDAGGVVQKENYDAGYALRLEFGALANNRLPGKIYLCTPDVEKSYVLGSFNAFATLLSTRPPAMLSSRIR